MTTATNPVNPADTRRYFEHKEQARQEKLSLLLNRAQTDAGRIIDMIIRDYNPEKIWQWGSLLHTERFSEMSDIDIALEGPLSPRTFFEILNRADAMTPLRVDIVQLETIEPLHADSIRKNGRIAYTKAHP